METPVGPHLAAEIPYLSTKPMGFGRPQQRGTQDRQIERLGQEIVGPRPQRLDGEGQVSEGGHHHDRKPRVGGVELLGEGEPALPLQMHISEQDIRHGSEGFPRLGQCRDRAHLETRKTLPEQITQHRIVFQDQHARQGHVTLHRLVDHPGS